MSHPHTDRILIIRFHAIGDTAITLPSCCALAQVCPESTLEYLTTIPAAPLVRALDPFREVHLFPECRTRAERILAIISTVRILRSKKYTMVLDLQGNWVSRTLRKALRPALWSEFDRVAPLPAGIRVREALASAGFRDLDPPPSLPVRPLLLSRSRQILTDAGWDGKKTLVLLNPAGFWKSRHWPESYFATLARLLTNSSNREILFVGTHRIRTRVSSIQDLFGSPGIDLVGRTSLEEAFGVVQHTALVVSEDSGLMHMAWVSGIPTVALFGSTRHDWAAPLGPHTRYFHSGDLPCSACMSAECHYGDVHCMTRVTPARVHKVAVELLDSGTKSL